MMRKNWLAAVVAVVLSSLVLAPVANARGPYPAATALAAELLQAAGVRGVGPYISRVAGMMGPETGFNGVEKSDVEAYRVAVAGFLESIGAFGGFTPAGTGRLHVLIGFTVTPGPAEEALVHAASGTVKYRYHLIPAIAAELPSAAIENLLRNPRITVVEPDIDVHAVDLQGELNATWGVSRIGAGTVHGQGYLGTGVKVAVIDTGIDYNHPELAVAYAGGYDFVNKDADPMDDEGHGTHVAGTIAALRNGTGVVGVAPGVRLYALKVLGSNGSGKFSDVVAAVQWAVDNGIKVTNNSYGSSGDPGTLVKQAFDNAYGAGLLHVAAAGNSGRVNGSGDNVIYPARYGSVVAVSATSQSDERASWSSTGPAVELAAPGVSINSTLLGGGYGTKSGTSMASPHVAGVAALVWANHSSWTNTGVRDVLCQTAEDLGLAATQQGYGLVDAVAALGGTVPQPQFTLATSVSPAGAGTVSRDPNWATYPYGTVVALTASANPGYSFDHWIGVDTANGSAATVTMNSNKAVQAVFVEQAPPAALTVNVSTDKASYTKNSWALITVEVRDLGGLVSDASVALSVTGPDQKTTTYSGVTGASGQVVFSHRILPKAGKGTYNVTATATLGAATGGATTTFVVR